MKHTSLFPLAWTVAAACSSSPSGTVDAPGGGSADAAIDAAQTPPRVIAGGGIGDGPIAGVMNIYAIDDVTRQPIAGATVTVGTAIGTTDATGLVRATGVTGKQSVLVTASGYRSELWVGVNGANVTVDLHRQTPAAPASATLSGSVDLSGFAVNIGHLKTASVTYSQDDAAGDAANNLLQTGGNVCQVGAQDIQQSCAFQVTARTGHVALVAAVFDHDPKTPDPTDDTFTLIGWEVRTGIVVAAGTPQSGQDLTKVSVGDTTTETVDFGTPPASLQTPAGIIGVELGADGVLQLPSFVTPTAKSLLVPKLSVFGSATYRFSAFAKASPTGDVATSGVLVHAQTGQTLTAGAWLTPPASASITRTHATWSAVTGATVQGLDIAAGSSDLLSVTAFDGTTSLDLPAAAGIPPTGTLTAHLTAIAAPGLDVTNFSLDAARGTLTAVASAPSQVAN